MVVVNGKADIVGLALFLLASCVYLFKIKTKVINVLNTLSEWAYYEM